jgi:hypothetical protein
MHITWKQFFQCLETTKELELDEHSSQSKFIEEVVKPRYDGIDALPLSDFGDHGCST